MKTLFESGFGKSMGQAVWPVRTPVAAPVVPPPPEIPAEKPRLVDADLRSKILSMISNARKDRAEVAAWWDANAERAREILGKRMPEYGQHLSNSMAQESLAETLQVRLNQAGQTYINDSEIVSMELYGLESRALHELVFGAPGEPGVAPAPQDGLALPALVAAGAFVAAILL